MAHATHELVAFSPPQITLPTSHFINILLCMESWPMDTTLSTYQSVNGSHPRHMSRHSLPTPNYLRDTSSKHCDNGNDTMTMGEHMGEWSKTHSTRNGR